MNGGLVEKTSSLVGKSRRANHNTLQLSIFLTTASEPGSVHRIPYRNALNMIGANDNLLFPNADADPISASVAHRGRKCRVLKP